MMFAKIDQKFIFLKNKNTRGNCHFGSLSLNVPNASTLRVSKIHDFHSPLLKLHFLIKSKTCLVAATLGAKNASSNHIQNAATPRILCS